MATRLKLWSPSLFMVACGHSRKPRPARVQAARFPAPAAPHRPRFPRALSSGSVGPLGGGRPKPPPLHSQSQERSAVPPERPKGLGGPASPIGPRGGRVHLSGSPEPQERLTSSPTDHALGCRKNGPAVTHRTFKSQILSGRLAANFR